MFKRADVIRFPSGKYGFVGRVPIDLAFEYDDVADVRIALQSGPGIARRIAEREGRVFRTRTWDTAEAALVAASNILGDQAAAS